MDASNLKRNLLLATQVIDLKFKTVVALNMMDEANKQGVIINIEELEKALGVKVIPLDSRHQIGFSELKKAILNAKISSAVFYDLTAAFIKEHGNYKKYISSSLAEDKNATSTQLENADKIYRFNTINYLIAKSVKSPEQLSLKKISSPIYTSNKPLVFLAKFKFLN